MSQMTWQQTDGEVVKVDSTFARGRRQLIITFSYEAQGYRYDGEMYTFKSLNVGDSLIVEYDASNPKLTKFKADYARKWRVWWIAIAAFLVASLLLMVWIAMLRH